MLGRDRGDHRPGGSEAAQPAAGLRAVHARSRRRCGSSTPATASGRPGTAPITGGVPVPVQITGSAAGALTTAGSVVMNVTVVTPSAAGFLTVYPNGAAGAERLEPQLRSRPGRAEPGDDEDRDGRRGQPAAQPGLRARHRRRHRHLRQLERGGRRQGRHGDAGAQARHPHRARHGRRSADGSGPARRSTSRWRAATSTASS